MNDLLQADSGHIPKGAVHFALGVTAGTCGAYSACAWSIRPTRRLALQTVFYFGILAVEGWQVFDHWSQR